MWPQKWKASAFCARIASSTKPPLATATRSRPVRARKPRRELLPAMFSLRAPFTVTVRLGDAMGGAWQGRMEHAYPADTRVTEDAVHAPHSAAPGRKASL